jgi:hypothetical protein
MRIVGIDLARHCGLSVIERTGNFVACETWHFKQTEHSIVVHEYFIRLRQFMVKYEVDGVAFEDLHAMGGMLKSHQWRSLWYGLRWATVLQCELVQVAWMGVLIRQWRATGGLPLAGKVSPAQVVDAARRVARVGPLSSCNDLRTDHESVGLLVALTAMEHL